MASEGVCVIIKIDCEKLDPKGIIGATREVRKKLAFEHRELPEQDGLESQGEFKSTFFTAGA